MTDSLRDTAADPPTTDCHRGLPERWRCAVRQGRASSAARLGSGHAHRHEHVVRWRRRAGAAAVIAVALTGVAAAPVYGPLVVLPAACALAGVLGVLGAWPYGGLRSAVVTTVVSVVSLATTACVRLLGEPHMEQRPAGGWVLVESASLLVLIIVVVRVAPARHALVSGGLAGAAATTWILRFGLWPPSVMILAGFTGWALLALLAASAGLYLRSLDAHRTRSVSAARRAQRLQLARDLHDFVAHDVSEMLAQAQAGQIVAESDPRAAVATFRRIEQAALQALASMDRTVRMLHDADDPAAGDTAGRAPLPTLVDLPELAARFSASGTAAIRLDIDPRLDDPESGGVVSREVATTVYRVVVEALTNVRRHAPTASRVEVTIRQSRATGGVGGVALEVAVTDDARINAVPAVHALRPADRRSGLGLPGLTERVQALGGTLTAGPCGPSGWRVSAVLPLAPTGPGVRTRSVTT